MATEEARLRHQKCAGLIKKFRSRLTDPKHYFCRSVDGRPADVAIDLDIKHHLKQAEHCRRSAERIVDCFAMMRVHYAESVRHLVCAYARNVRPGAPSARPHDQGGENSYAWACVLRGLRDEFGAKAMNLYYDAMTRAQNVLDDPEDSAGQNERDSLVDLDRTYSPLTLALHKKLGRG